jgi:hypothetical protein
MKKVRDKRRGEEGQEVEECLDWNFSRVEWP